MRKRLIIFGTILGLAFLILVAPKKDDSMKPVFNEPAAGDNSLVYFFDSDKTGNYEIYKHDETNKLVQLTDNVQFDSWWPRISPDKKTLLFYRTPKGTHDKDYAATSLWLVDLRSGKEEELIANKANGWQQHGHAEWSPDGKKLVMFAGSQSNPQIWTANARGKDIKQITNDGGVNLDPSWSNSGKEIAYVACPDSVCLPSNQEIYVFDLLNGERTRKTQDDIRDQDPYFSPDDSEIAFLSQAESRSLKMPAGAWDIRLARTIDGKVISQTNFGNITSLPAWSEDGKHIFTHQLIYGENTGFDLVKISKDNMSSISKLINQASNQEYISF